MRNVRSMNQEVTATRGKEDEGMLKALAGDIQRLLDDVINLFVK